MTNAARVLALPTLVTPDDVQSQLRCARCASPPRYLVRCRWWTPREYMSGPLACRAPEGPVCCEARAWCDVAAGRLGVA